MILEEELYVATEMNSFYYPKVKSIEIFDVSTLYTSIPHKKLKERVHLLINQTFLYTIVRRKLGEGGGAWLKKFFEPHYFFRLQKPISRKVGVHAPGSYGTVL